MRGREVGERKGNEGGLEGRGRWGERKGNEEGLGGRGKIQE